MTTGNVTSGFCAIGAVSSSPRRHDWAAAPRSGSEMSLAVIRRGLAPSDCEPVKLGDVTAGDLESVRGAGVFEVALDDLLRMRPGRGLVRVVTRPHDAVHADKVATGDADKIVDIGRPHLPPEILARLQLLRKPGRSARTV